MQIRTKGELYLTKAECKKPREQTRISPATKNKVANKNRNQNPKNTLHWETQGTQEEHHTNRSNKLTKTRRKSETEYTDDDDETRNR